LNKTDYSGLTVALILGAGSGSRAELGYNKLLHPVGGKTIIEYTLDKFDNYHKIITAAPSDREEMALIAAKYDNTVVITGGASRFNSVKRGLNYIENCDLVIIHDGARPNVGPDLIDETVAAAAENGGAVVFTPCSDTIKDTSEEKFTTLPRSNLIAVQTPQVFDYSMLSEAMEETEGDYSDDSQIFEAKFHNCALVAGGHGNYKITTMADIKRFEAEQNPQGGKMRIGNGYDIHRFSLGYKLMLGGVEIPHYEGLKGHSDADAVIHAVADSLLSAAGERDIGYYFPDTDEKNRGMASSEILEKVLELLKSKKLKILNLSVTIITERPKLHDHIDAIKKSLSSLLGIESDCLGVTAKTNEGLDAIGDNRALAVHAVSLLSEV
jgi:2-C-methyl-D-erythritol 4-phosphate cytidylyltransferase/2-C-methyl-D-erythritol 2,4-cyclodiphosphate synthase